MTQPGLPCRWLHPRTIPRIIVPSLLAALWLTAPVRAAEDPTSDPHQERRHRMVERQIEQRGVTNETTLKAMREVPRHRFVPNHLEDQAYSDHPLPIGHGQTISQPYIVGLMTEMLALKPDDKVLEIGTGSGYQAAVLHAITTNTYTMEIVPELAEQAGPLLADSGMNPGQVRQGDGYFGWEEHAPFDAIIVTAAADHIPPSLLRQLRPGGRMVIPIGPVHATQRLVLVTKDDEEKVRTRSVLPVRFVPLTGGPRNRD